MAFDVNDIDIDSIRQMLIDEARAVEDRELAEKQLDMQTKTVIKAIRNNYGMEIDDNEYDLSINNKRALKFAIAGLILLIINVLTEHFGIIFSNFLSVVWWVAIWDMVEILFLENQEIKWKRLNNQQLYDSTIKFVFEENYQNEKIEKDREEKIKI